ncbi:M1 family metallopeptidase [Sphingomonas qilianensis]|uniref:Aminopeptidase n=1 Tax=Sphingomonas qilianensis TaxID=1736690 RepID=A0ABU9XQM2_9SPHN
MAPLVLLAVSVSSPALAAGQLPKTVVPVAYDITITPDAQAMTFTGTETATVDVRQATRSITLNAAELAVTAATFDGRPARYTLDSAKQELTVALPAAASVGRHTLTFAWKGKINTSAAGMFAIDYANPDGKPARLLVTQFEAPDARRFAPMWDEPGLKAKFTLSAVSPAGQTAFSNMPATKITKRADGSQLYNFGQTPIMSSYLLFLGMGDVERHTIAAGKTEIGVITRRGVGAQSGYALDASKRLLSFYNDYFGTPYPLPKMDMIGGPGSSQFFGAMENWGAIFYFENELLFDPARASESQKQRIYTVIAHEMAHQWFGDLVTMAWWDDLWLNEGFASWMEGKATDALNPQWNAAAALVGSEREGGMAQDAVASTHPVIRKLETVDEIGQAFDSITYQKGQAVIGMVEAYVGADAFRTGVRNYMAKYKYSNTVTDQLWSEIGAAAGKPVAEIAHDFTLQGGVPLITVHGTRCAGGSTSAVLSQGRFGLDAASKAPTTWRVPVTMAVLGGGEGDAIVRGAGGTTLTAKGCGTVIVNRGKAGYYRVQYDAPGHDAIVRDFTRLALADQLGTLGDDLALALSGDQDLSRYLALQAAVPADADPLVWNMISGQIGGLAGVFNDTPLEAGIDARSRAILRPVLDKIGIVPVTGENPLVSTLRESLIGRLGAAGDPAVAQAARAYVAKLSSDPTAIPPGIRLAILRVYAANATPAEWDALLALTRAEQNPVVKNGYVTLLGNAKDPALAQRAIDLVKTEEFSAPQRASLLRAIANRHPDAAFDFAAANVKMVDTFNEQSSRPRYIVGLAAGSNDAGMPAKIRAFAAAHLAAPSREGATRTINAVEVRKATMERLRPAVLRWTGG